MTTNQELLKALREMRILAHEALDLAERSHGGHGYESLRSTAAQKCCEVRMLIDDLKLEYTKLADQQHKRELPKRWPRRSSK